MAVRKYNGMKLSLINEVWPFSTHKPIKPHEQPEYKAAFAALIKKHGGDEAKAAAELAQLARTPAGQYQLRRAGTQHTQHAQEIPPEKVDFKAKSLSAPAMYQS